MASFSFSLTLTLIFFSTITTSSEKLNVNFFHRFSDEVRRWEESKGLSSMWNQEEAPRGSVEYYNMLLKHDLNRHKRRFLAQGDQYSFTVEGNQTNLFTDALHYAYVALGTPNQKFFVLLDTGSALFWLPCNCQQCAPISSPSYGDMKFTEYMPNVSSTSKRITCGDKQCDARFGNICLNKSADCNYQANYASPGSTSGVIMQDVLLFMNEQNRTDTIKLPIVFGCGEVQTGALQDSVPNGIMGLGLDSLSVPSMLAKGGIISDSFSMCFADGNGRLNFGDKGNSRQYETPFVPQKGRPYYNINITGMVVGNKTMDGKFITLVDSGTNFALFEDPFYTQLGTSFAAQVKDKPLKASNLPFDYCYISGDPNVTYPSVSFITKGDDPFPILNPIVYLADQNGNQAGYCLAMVQSTDTNVLGDVFMTGLNVVFDRERLVLGWQEADCYGGFYNKSLYSSPTPTPSPISPPELPKKASGQRVGLNTLIFIFEIIFCLVLFH